MAAETETWLPVVDYEGFYEVSDLGRVRSLRSGCGRGGTQPRPRPLILQFHWKPDGYLHVDLKKDGRHSQPRVHKIVLTAFRGRRPERHEGAHWDGEKANNRLDNLRWTTSLENKADMLRHGVRLRGDTHPGAKLTVEAVIQIRSDNRPSHEVAADHGVCSSTVRYIKRRDVWTHV